MPKDLLFPGTIIALHRKAVETLLTAADSDAALLYLCLVAEKDGSLLKWDAARLEAAQTTLVALKLLDVQTPVRPAPPQKLESEAPPEYSTADVSIALQNEAGFAALVPEVQRLLGKVLSPSDVKTLYLLFDFLALPPEVILVLVGWCVEDTAERYGAGRKPTMTQIKREGHRWQKAGVDTLDAADAHLRRLTEQGTRSVQILEILGIRRKPVGSEQTYLNNWIKLQFADDVLQLAYEKTLFQLQKFSWSYMNGILMSWKKQGLTTVREIQEGEGRRKPSFVRQSVSQQPILPSDDIGRMMAEAEQYRKKEG